MSSTLELTAAGIAREVAQGRLGAEETARAHFDAIRREDPRLRAFLSLMEEEALAQARAVDAKRARGEKLGRLAGVPVALKDNMLVRGHSATCGSKILEGYRATYDGCAAERLKAEDAVIVGKTNLDEFAMGSSTENSAFFKTVNPWDTSRVPGGSSGGSAAAAATGLCALSFGSDTGGSIRQPASFCGVVGLKPTYGAVSRYGLVAFASSLDQIGPFARTVEDAALAFSVVSGHDERDTTSSARDPYQFPAGLDRAGDLKGLRVGLPKEYFIPGTDPEVEKKVRAAVEVLKGLGAEIREVSLPHTSAAVATYYIVAPSEASSNLARFDGIRYGRSSVEARTLEEVYEFSRGEGFGPEVKRRIMLGTYALSSGYYDAYYGKAQRVRTLVKRDFDQAFQEVDVLATPTAPTAAFKLGEKTSDPMSMYLSDVFTIPCNLAGIGGISIPCGLTSGGLPVGLQLLAAPFQEPTLLRAAAAYEKAAPFPRLGAAK